MLGNRSLWILVYSTFLTLTATTAMDLSGFKWIRIQDSDQMVQSANRTFPAVSLLVCATSCGQMQPSSCPSFSYDFEQRMCYLGPTLSTGTSSEVHFREVIESVPAGFSAGGIPSDYTVMADGVTHIKVHKENPLKPWTEAQDICNSEGAHLVRMKTTTKKNNLNQALSDMGMFMIVYSTYTGAAGQEYWVDSTFTEGENIYRWGDGDPVDSSLFANGEPNGLTAQHCLRVFWDLQLADDDCGNAHRFVCEIP
ncbi:hypothetical protein BaRGS_00018756 [Batillaria attramentaria]|uniref:C-type lectin domain-containing protein n=1 Tax=Batillaria attramentaria TaxID=370345 RepID=A0ABD0KSN2_9CAEN